MGLARASLSNLSMSLPVAHVFAVTWRLSVCVSWPFMRAFFWSFALIRSWASYDDGLYISLAHLCFFLCCLPCWLVIPAVMTQSCWAPFWAGHFIPFLSGLSLGTVLFPFTHRLLCPFVFSFWASTARLLILLGFLGLFANSTLPWALLLTSLGFPGPITLSLSLGFMGLP